MTLRRRSTGMAAALAALAWGLAPVAAGDPEAHVRIVQIKASETRVPGKAADLDRDLEPLRAHLEKLPVNYRRFQYLDNALKHAAAGSPLVFELQNGYRATATPTFEGDRITLVLLVTKVAPAGSGAKDEKVFETTTKLKDSATSVQAIAGGVAGGDLLLAITVSKDPL